MKYKDANNVVDGEHILSTRYCFNFQFKSDWFKYNLNDHVLFDIFSNFIYSKSFIETNLTKEK